MGRKQKSFRWGFGILASAIGVLALGAPSQDPFEGVKEQPSAGRRPPAGRLFGENFTLKLEVLLLALVAVSAILAAGLGKLPALMGYPLGALLFCFTMTASMRAIGFLYHRNRDRLGWEG